MAITEIGNTLVQMGKNAVGQPGEFVGFGLSQTRKAATRALSTSLPSLKPAHQRALPDENTSNGDLWGSRLRDSFVPSRPSHPINKEHACNQVSPGSSNIYGGRLDLVG